MEKASALRPHDVETLNNLADTQVQFGDLREAAATYDRVRAIDPGDANAALGAAHLDLLNGYFEAGWAGREARWKVPGLPIVYPTFPQPMWLGKESIAGKTILIYADEGMGDAIQLARYLPDLADRGATVILAVHAALQPLLSGVAGVSQCVVKSATEALPPFDMFCPMLSLPLAFGTRLETIPARIPYLPPPAAAAVAELERTACFARQAAGRPRMVRQSKAREGRQTIDSAARAYAHPRRRRNLRQPAEGIAAGRQIDPRTNRHPRSDRRSPGFHRHRRAALLPRSGDHGGHQRRPSRRRARATRLGAVAVFSPDYRWLLGRDDSPWYPSLRLFRQTESREYGSVVDRVRAELVALARSRLAEQ